MSTPTNTDIEDQQALADDAMENGSKFPGMSYEEGVSATIRWIQGDSDDKPMEE